MIKFRTLVVGAKLNPNFAEKTRKHRVEMDHPLDHSLCVVRLPGHTRPFILRVRNRWTERERENSTALAESVRKSG